MNTASGPTAFSRCSRRSAFLVGLRFLRTRGLAFGSLGIFAAFVAFLLKPSFSLALIPATLPQAISLFRPGAW